MTSFSLFLWTLATGCLHIISKQVPNLQPSPFTIDTLGCCRNVFRKSKSWETGHFLWYFMKSSAKNFPNLTSELFRKSNIFPEIFGKIPNEISGNFPTHIHNYNLSYISNIIARVVAWRFDKQISNWHLFLVQQPAYHPFHSTETAVLSVNNDLVRTIDNGQVSLLVLLDLSTAFDTRDHSILLSVLFFRALVGLAINICRAAVGAVPYTLVLPSSCQQCKASSGH